MPVWPGVLVWNCAFTWWNVWGLRFVGVSCWAFWPGILALFFLAWLPMKNWSLKQGFLRKFSWPSLNPDVPRSSTVVYLEVHPNHVVRIESLELEAASDWQDWELESTITKHGRQPRTVLEFSNNSYQFKTSPFTNKPFSNYKMINFQSTPCPAIPRKTIQWNIHTIPPTTPAPPPTGCKHPNPFIRGLRFYHHRSQGKRRSPLWFLPYQWGRGWIPWVDWLMLVAFENRKVFQNRIQDLVGCNTVFGSWDDEFYEYSLYDPRRGAFKIFFMFKFDNDFLWEVDAWHVDTID